MQFSVYFLSTAAISAVVHFLRLERLFTLVRVVATVQLSTT